MGINISPFGYSLLAVGFSLLAISYWLALRKSLVTQHVLNGVPTRAGALFCSRTIGKGYNFFCEISNHIRICFAILRWFIKFSIMGWIWIGSALLKTLYECQIHRFFDPLVKNNFSSELRLFRIEAFFELAIFSQFSPNPYTRMCVSTIEPLSPSRKTVKNQNQLPVQFCLFWFSRIFDFYHLWGKPFFPMTYCLFLAIS